MTLRGPADVASDPRAIWRERIVRLIKGRSLADCLSSRRDNILHLRLIAAFAVVFAHCGLGGIGTTSYDVVHRILPATYVHVAGLIMFFVISGFLITSSFDRHADLLRFLRARALRIWPALAVCGLGVAFVLGPLLATVPLRDYFAVGSADSPYRYAWGSLSIFDIRLSIAGLFAKNPVSHFANGPLWTIPVEAAMYLWVGAAGALRLFRFPWLTSLGIAAIFSVLILWPMMTGPFDTMNTKLSLQGFFGAGSIAYLLRRHIPISTGLMIVITAAAILAQPTIHATPFTWLMIFYFVFWFSYVPRLPAIPRQADISYGVYIWAWPIQQMLVQLIHVRDPLALFAVTTIVVTPIAAASWFLIEKPALRLKDARFGRSREMQPA